MEKTSGTKISDITKEEFMEYTNGVWTFNGESKKRIGHLAPFSKELPYRAIKLNYLAIKKMWFLILLLAVEQH